MALLAGLFRVRALLFGAGVKAGNIVISGGFGDAGEAVGFTIVPNQFGVLIEIGVGGDVGFGRADSGAFVFADGLL